MTVSFIDIKNGFWAYDEITEAANTFLADGTPLMEGLPYQVFEPGKGYIYEEFKAGKNQVRYVLSKVITPTDSNPLYAFVDGVQYGYRSTEKADGKTVVILYTPPAQGSIVSFMSPGVPKLERGRPVTRTASYYPHYKLKNYDTYTYYPANGFNEYLTVFGKRLKRIMLTQDDLAGTSVELTEYDQNLARKYIGSKTDVYIISPSGRIHLPWNFEGMSGTITYAYNNGGIKKTTETFIAWTTSKTDTAHEPYHNDRFFPSVWVTRAEAVMFIDRLRRYFYERFTDLETPGPILDFEETAYQGQRVFRLNGYYPSGKGHIKVFSYDEEKVDWVTLTRNTQYTEFDDHTILLNQPVEKGTRLRFYFEKNISDHLYDVGRNVRYYDKTNGKMVSINGTTDDWVAPILAIDSEILKDGTKLINGKSVSSFYDPIGKTIPITDDYYRPAENGEGRRLFMPHTPISRSECIAFVNRFRKWCLERFL